MPNETRITHNLKPFRSRHRHRGTQVAFYLIYTSSLFCLIATGWAAALFA